MVDPFRRADRLRRFCTGLFSGFQAHSDRREKTEISDICKLCYLPGGIERVAPLTTSPKPCHDIHAEAFCPLPLWARLLMTLGPLVAFGLLLLVVGIVSTYKTVLFIVTMVIGSFVGGGKLVVFFGAAASAPVDIWPLAALVVFGDMATALILVSNMHVIYRIPALGVHLARAREAGFVVLQTHPWMRRVTFFGLATFVAVPFQGTGAVLGVFLGRILGLSRTGILMAVLAGSATGASAMALFATMGEKKIESLAANPVLGVITVVVTLLLTVILGRWFLGQAGRPSRP
jgi:uncharacterized membrane protein